MKTFTADFSRRNELDMLPFTAISGDLSTVARFERVILSDADIRVQGTVCKNLKTMVLNWETVEYPSRSMLP